MNDRCRKERLIYLLLVILFVLVRILLVNEPLNSDDLTYFHHSKALTTGEHVVFKNELPQRLNHNSLRFGILIPEAILIRIAGPNFIAYYLLPLVFSMAGFLLIIKISREFLSFGIVIVAAVIHIVLPFETRHSSLLLTDLPAALFLVAYIYYVYKHETNKSDVKKLFLHSSIASFLIFWGYLLRENQFILLLPAITVFLFYRRYRWIALGSIAFFFLWLMGEQLLYISKGAPFGYRWVVAKADIDSYSKFIAEYRLNEFILRSFKFVLKDIGHFGLLFYLASIVFHIYAFFVSKHPLVKSILFSGAATFIIFNFSIYEITDGVIRAMVPPKHRYLQMFYYSSLIAISFSLHHIFTLARKRLSVCANMKNLRAALKYVAVLAIILVFIPVLVVFWHTSYHHRRRLLNPSGKYMSLLSAIKEEMTENTKERIKIYGTTRSLRAISLFNFISPKHFINWHGVSYEDLRLRLEEKQADYFVIDQKREITDLRYFKGQAKKDRKAILDNISQIAAKNFHPVYTSKDFKLFKSCNGG